MKITLLMAVVGLAVGLMTGYWVTPVGSEAAETRTEFPNDNLEKDRVVDEPSRPAQANGPIRAAKNTQAPVEQDFADVAACTREAERLTAKVKQLRIENMMQKKELEFAAGKPIPFPPDLDPKYLEPALMKNLNMAYKEVGLDGDVSFVDCDEYPCVVCADLKVKGKMERKERMEALHEKTMELRDSKPMSIYGTTEQTSAVLFTGDAHEERWTNCQIIYPRPKGKSAGKALSERLNLRLMHIYRSL